MIKVGSVEVERERGLVVFLEVEITECSVDIELGKIGSFHPRKRVEVYICVLNTRFSRRRGIQLSVEEY